MTTITTCSTWWRCGTLCDLKSAMLWPSLHSLSNRRRSTRSWSVAFWWPAARTWSSAWSASCVCVIVCCVCHRVLCDHVYCVCLCCMGGGGGWGVVNWRLCDWVTVICNGLCCVQAKPNPGLPLAGQETTMSVFNWRNRKVRGSGVLCFISVRYRNSQNYQGEFFMSFAQFEI